jgi:pilus assembly protein Flp/PilA
MAAIMALKAWYDGRSNDETGASLVEYALLVALIAIVCIGAMSTVGGGVANTLNGIAGSLG